MGAFSEFIRSRAERDSPAFAQRMAHNREQAYAQDQANLMSKMAGHIYGQQAQAAVPDEFNARPDGQPIEFGAQPDVPGVTAQPASGLFAEGVSDDVKLQLMNKRMLESGIAGFNKQWAGNQRDMQGDMMGNLGQMARQKQAQKVGPKPTSMMQNVRASMPNASAEQYQQAMTKQLNKSGVTVNTGGGNLEPGWMSSEKKAEQNIPKDIPIWVNAKGDPKVVAAPDVMTKKTAVALDQLEVSTDTLNEVLGDYDPNSLAELTTAMLPLPTPLANKLRNETERTVASAKKGWKELVLRDATGAVINASEYTDYDDIYMPQAGESKTEWTRKAKLRHSKENAYRRRVGVPEKSFVSPYAPDNAPANPKPGDKWTDPKTGETFTYKE